MFYFGAWRNPGHFLWTPEKRRLSENRFPVGFPCRIHALDGGFLRPNASVQGECAVWHTDGWVVIAWPDRTCDSRPGSNSAFILKVNPGESNPMALKRATEAFPEIGARVGKFLIDDGIFTYGVEQCFTKYVR